MTSHVAGFQEPAVTPKKQKRSSVTSTSTGNGTTFDKSDAALRAATLSFSPPITRQPSDEISTSPAKTNGAALIAARAIGTGTPPRPLVLNSPDRAATTGLSKNSSSDAALPTSTTTTALQPTPAFSAPPLLNVGSLKAAQLSVSRSPSTASGTVSRARSSNELNLTKAERAAAASHAEDAVSGYAQADGSLTAAKLSAVAKKGKGQQGRINSGRNDSPPSLLAAGLAVSRLTASGTMAPNQPERDQEPDILPPAGSVSEAKKRLLQHADDGGVDVPVRGRRSIDAPLRSKHSGTFSDPPPQSTVNISPLSAAKLAVQHSGRSAGASSMGPSAASSKPRQPSPIKKEIKRDITPTNHPIAPPPKPAILKKPTIQSIKITETPLPAPKPSPKPSPKPAVKPSLNRLVTQDTGTPPPQPIKPLPRKTKGPNRASKILSSIPDTSPTANFDGSKSSKPVQKIPSKITTKTQNNVVKEAPPLPLPRGTKAAVDGPKLVEDVMLEPPTALRTGDPVKQPPPIVKPRSTEPIKHDIPIVKPKPVEPAKPDPLPVVNLRTKPVEPVKPEPPIASPRPVEAIKQELPIARPKPEPAKPKFYVDSIVSRQPPSLYQNKEKNSSTATLPVLPPPRMDWNRRTSSTTSLQMLRQNRTGPDSTRTPPPRPAPSWRDDLPYNFPPQEEPIRPSHTGESLRHALAASSLASSRAGSPVKSNPLPLPPRHSPAFRTTMRTQEKPQERETSPHKKNHLLGKKHPNKHNEGARKRWREFVTEKERKRYEGLWAANRGLYLTERMFDSRPDARGRNLHQDAVAAIVVKELWSRSRLPLDILEQIWDLVDRGPRPKFWLTREEFIMGLWLIDQSLKGRKLPGKVQDGTWESVRRMGVVLKGYEELGLKDKNVKRVK
ncbi:hypothetical protein ABW19_dt0203276 [Dactylella cylindrospora]|nr:hypothetical protein ABW19_dt0203276 [Dactylella cylindrospora]